MKHLFLSFLLCTLLSACKPQETITTSNQKAATHMNKYEWLAKFTSPRQYNWMHITGGYFILEDDSKMPIYHGYIPMGRWGNSSGTRVVGPKYKYLPKQLNITWFSILENQAYQAECLFPFDQLKQDAENGFSNVRSFGWEDKPFNRFTTGIAPGGYIQVWASSGAAQITIGYCQGKPVDVPFETTRLSEGGGYKSWQHYVQTYKKKYTSQELKTLEEKAFPINIWRDIYTKRYPYTIKTSGMRQETAYTDLVTFGDEYYIFGAPKTPADRYDTHGAPSMLDVFTLSSKDNQHREESYRVYFDEAETLAAFEKFTEITQGKPFELHAELDDLKHLKIRLVYREHSYQFKKTRRTRRVKNLK